MMFQIRKIDFKKDLDIVADLLAEAFSKDPLFQMVFREKSRYKKMKAFFMFSLKPNILLKDAVFIATINDKIAGVCSISYPNTKNEPIYKIPFLLNTLKLILQIGLKPFLLLNQYFKLTLKSKKDRFYLNFIGVAKTFRKQGVAKNLLEYVHQIVKTDKSVSEIRLDTENPDNIGYYKRYAYQVIEEEKLKKITIYFLVKRFQ